MPDPTQIDIDAAALRLRDVLATRRDGDYGPTTVLGDLVVDANTVVYGDLTLQIGGLKTRSSLRDLRRLPASPDVDDATDGILSNLLITRMKGLFAAGRCTVIFSRRGDTLVPRTARFFRTPSLVFYPNSASDLFFPASAMRPVFNGAGAVTGYALDVSLIAARVGTAYNVERGAFSSVDPFSPYIVSASHAADFAGGYDKETSSDAIARAPTAMALRALVNDRSNDARLREAFPTVSRVLTVGAGDPEMARDLTGGALGSAFHAGGHFDVYVELPLQSRTERLLVGEPTARADGLTVTFRDPSAPSGSFVTAGVQVGDVFVVSAGLAGAPLQFRVAAVRGREIDVRASVPFPEATESLDSPPAFTYTIGNNFPLYDNHVPATTTTTAVTSSSSAVPGWVTLPGGAVYEVTQVSVPAPPSALSGFVDPITGAADYTSRRNGPWARPPRAGEALSFRVAVENPLYGQSPRAVTRIELGWPGEDLAGTEVLVTYTQPVGLDSVDELVRASSERPSSSNVLARAAHPIYVSVSVPYRPRALPTGFGSEVSVQVVDEPLVVTTIAALVRGALPGTLDRDLLLSTVNLGTVYPFSIVYELHLPDGRIARYATEDRVEMVPSGGTARLTNAADLGLPADYTLALRDLLRRYGMSDRVVRYVTDAQHISLERRG